jgi:hypothetical protein
VPLRQPSSSNGSRTPPSRGAGTECRSPDLDWPHANSRSCRDGKKQTLTPSRGEEGKMSRDGAALECKSAFEKPQKRPSRRWTIYLVVLFMDSVAPVSESDLVSLPSM